MGYAGVVCAPQINPSPCVSQVAVRYSGIYKTYAISTGAIDNHLLVIVASKINSVPVDSDTG